METQKIQNALTPAVTEHVALFLASMSSFLTPFIGSSVSIALPSIGKQLELNALELKWVGTAYLLAAAAFLVPLGRFANIYCNMKYLDS